MTTSLVLFKAWLQRSGNSLGEVVGRVEVEVERRRGRCRRSGRVMARTALTGQPRQAMCGLGAGPRGFFFQQKSAQYSASGIGWTRTTFQTLSPDAPAEPNQPASPREGKEGRCADICPIRKPPPQALDATGTRAFRVGLQCAFVPSGPSLSPPLAQPWPCRGPAVAFPSPRIVCAQAARLPNSAPVHVGTLVNVALRSLVLSRDPCPRMHRKSANGRGPGPFNWTPAVRFRGPLLSPARFSPLGASSPHVSMGPETRLVSQVHK